MAAGCGWGDPGNVAEETVKVVTFCLPCLSNKMSFFIHLFTFNYKHSFLISYIFVSLLDSSLYLPLDFFYFLN